ncbi:MAG TPA: P-loop NTPase fold protein [Conexibacter sp.]|nr:P-loop NTPase fold protein [Conexibacter sp.]
MVDRPEDDYAVFLSYPGGSRGDSEHARQLSDLLAGYGFRAWMAERELGRHATPDAIGAQLATVPVFVACLGGRQVGRWGMEELRRAAERAMEDRDFVICTVVFPGGHPAALSGLPAAFASAPLFDLRLGVTSVAALMPLLWKRLDPGRSFLLDRIVGRLRDGPGPVILRGGVGVGKSKLAEVVLATLADDFPDGRAIVSIDPARTTQQTAGLILRIFGVDTADIPRDRRREAYLEFTAGGRYLVVLDDVDGYDVEALLPASPSAAVVVGRQPPTLVPSSAFDVTPSLWQHFGPARPLRTSAPGFASDLPEGEDLLDIGGAVDALCSVVAARDVAPPLSIGLFGDWGMGKSFFLRRMRARIDDLSAASRDVLDSAFFGDIRQIEFNAWHYADASLWASLAARVFEGLADDQGEQQRIARELVKSGAQLAEAQAEQVAAQARVTQAEEAIERAKRELVEAKVSLREAVEATGDLMRDDRRLADVMDDLRDARRLPLVLLLPGIALVLAAVVLALVAPAWPGAVVAAVAGGFALLLGPLRWGAKALRLAARWQRAVADRNGAREIVRLEVEVDALRARELDASRHLEAAEQQAAEAQQAVEEIASGRRLVRFIEERADGSAYRPYQGVVDLVRRDFDRLAELIAGHTPGTADGLPRIERIVLYVDDLDRCPTRRVVEVLEAVHLLLASNLFVVVVAVDPRWLLRALEHHYRGEMDVGDGRTSVTARDYLEKIFQIPFALPRMDDAAFGRLVDDLLPADAPAGPSTRSAPSGQLATAGGSTDSPKPGSVRTSEPERAWAPPLATIDLHPEGLRVQSAERAFMQRLAGLIETPRAAKRLTNVYRLLRVSLDAHELGALLGRDGAAPEYPCVQLLLAVAVGVPSLSPVVLPRVQTSTNGTGWWTVIDDPGLDEGDADAARRLRAGLRELRDQPLPPIERFADWVPHVQRYSYGLV